MWQEGSLNTTWQKLPSSFERLGREGSVVVSQTHTAVKRGNIGLKCQDFDQSICVICTQNSLIRRLVEFKTD